MPLGQVEALKVEPDHDKCRYDVRTAVQCPSRQTAGRLWSCKAHELHVGSNVCVAPRICGGNFSRIKLATIAPKRFKSSNPLKSDLLWGSDQLPLQHAENNPTVQTCESPGPARQPRQAQPVQEHVGPGRGPESPCPAPPLAACSRQLPTRCGFTAWNVMTKSTESISCPRSWISFLSHMLNVLADFQVQTSKQ